MGWKKGQTAIEFLVLMGFLLFFFAGFFLIIQGNLGEKIQENQNLLVQDVAAAIQTEINLAWQSSEGYLRVFKISEKIGNLDYEASITEGDVYVRTTNGKYATAVSVPPVVGDLVKGENTIRKQGGLVYLNQ